MNSRYDRDPPLTKDFLLKNAKHPRHRARKGNQQLESVLLANQANTNSSALKWFIIILVIVVLLIVLYLIATSFVHH